MGYREDLTRLDDTYLLTQTCSVTQGALYFDVGLWYAIVSQIVCLNRQKGDTS